MAKLNWDKAKHDGNLARERNRSSEAFTVTPTDPEQDFKRAMSEAWIDYLFDFFTFLGESQGADLELLALQRFGEVNKRNVVRHCLSKASKKLRAELVAEHKAWKKRFTVKTHSV